MANAYGNLGIVYKTRGDLKAAEDMHKKALAINEELGRKEGMANAYGNLGIVYNARGDLKAAEGMYKKALAIFTSIGDNIEIRKTKALIKKLKKSKKNIAS